MLEGNQKHFLLLKAEQHLVLEREASLKALHRVHLLKLTFPNIVCEDDSTESPFVHQVEDLPIDLEIGVALLQVETHLLRLVLFDIIDLNAILRAHYNRRDLVLIIELHLMGQPILSPDTRMQGRL